MSRTLMFCLGAFTSTGLCYGLYVILSMKLNFQIAYLMGYVLSVLFSYWFNASLVFKVKFSWKGFVSFPLVYVIQYVLSALLLELLVSHGLNLFSAPLLVMMAMLPLTYLMSKVILLRPGSSPPRHSI